MSRTGVSIGRTGGDAGVVDKDVELLFVLGELLAQAPDRVLVTDVCSKRNNLAGDVLAVRLDNTVKLLLRAIGNVDLSRA